MGSFNIQCVASKMKISHYDEVVVFPLFKHKEPHGSINVSFNIKEDFEKAGLFKSIEAMPEIELDHDILNSNQYEVYFVTSISEHLHSDRLNNLQNSHSSERLFTIRADEDFSSVV